MPEFTNPFSGIVPRRLGDSEPARALRLDLAAEEEESKYEFVVQDSIAVWLTQPKAVCCLK